MSYVRTFEQIAAPRRNDQIPFASVTVAENQVATFNTATEIETFQLTPLDPNPYAPMKRTFTTSLSQVAQNAHYWLIWKDASANQMIVGPFQIDPEEAVLTDFEKLIRSEFPRTWDGLVRDNSIGIELLRIRINNVKAMYLSAEMVYNDPIGYSPVLAAYISKRCVLDLVPTGIEYWMRQKVTLSTTGTNETTSFTDPISALKAAARQIQMDVEKLAASPGITIFAQDKGDAPGVTFGGDPITSNPYEWQPAFATDETVGQERTA